MALDSEYSRKDAPQRKFRIQLEKISKKNQLQPRKKDEADVDYLKRITHLYLQSQFIDKISAIPECASVTVVYLQNNLLRTIHNMDCFPKLTHLYLQHNFISKIENLNELTSLVKLYLGNNEISVVEGLEKLRNLAELHLESQRLPHGETVYFDPLTLDQLRNSLKVLNVSNNGMTSMLCLAELTSLNKLIIENNQLKNLDEVMQTLSRLPQLETLNSEGNPVATDRKFLDAVIVSSKSLKSLNGKQIDERTRLFVTNLAQNQERRKRMSGFSTRVFNSSESFPRAQRTSKPLSEFDSNGLSRLGSKLFPVLKSVVESRRRSLKTPLALPGNLSSVYENSLNVSHLTGSASYHL